MDLLEAIPLPPYLKPLAIGLLPILALALAIAITAVARHGAPDA